MAMHGPSHSGFPPVGDESFPDWQVVSFVDPAGAGKDLAFTRGLVAFELPELLLWARPTEGFDPGADWLLTHRERTRLLNCWALELVTGQLTSGARRSAQFDGGGTVACFRFARAAPVSHLQHQYLPPDTPVLSVAWSLQRGSPDTGEPVAMSLAPAVEQRMRTWIARAQATTLGWRLRLAACGADIPINGPISGSEVTTPVLGSAGRPAGVGPGSPGEPRYGPMTPWVEARIAQVLAAGAGVIAEFLARLHVATQARCEGCLMDELTRIATRSHRNGAGREALRAAQEAALLVIGWSGHPSPVWDHALALTVHPLLPPAELVVKEESLKVALTEGLEVLFVTAVLADRAPSWVLASGSGPWEWAVSDSRLPGRQWTAAPIARRRARDLLAAATPDQLAQAVEESRRPQALIERHHTAQLIMGLQTTAPASAQPGRLFRRDQGRGLPRPTVEAADRLAGQLLTALALPYLVPAENWRVIRNSLRPIVPDLPAEPPR